MAAQLWFAYIYNFDSKHLVSVKTKKVAVTIFNLALLLRSRASYTFVVSVQIVILPPFKGQPIIIFGETIISPVSIKPVENLPTQPSILYLEKWQ